MTDLISEEWRMIHNQWLSVEDDSSVRSGGGGGGSSGESLVPTNVSDLDLVAKVIKEEAKARSVEIKKKKQKTKNIEFQ